MGHMQPLSTRWILTLFVLVVLLGLVAMRVVMNHHNRVAAQVVGAHQTSLNGVRAKINALEQGLIADRTAREQLVEGCKEVLREAGAQLGGRLEVLLVQQEMRLIRTLEEMSGATRSPVAREQQLIQPGAHQTQTITPESHTAAGERTQIGDGRFNAETRR